MNAPFQWTKQIASHYGGVRNPMVISWPDRIGKDKQVRVFVLAEQASYSA